MKEYLKYLEDSVEKLHCEEAELAATHRKDEANLMKIRINIYGICKTVFEAISRQEAGEQLKEKYLAKLEEISRNWEISREKAKQHEDVEKVVTETIKLETVEKIKERFNKIWRAEQ